MRMEKRLERLTALILAGLVLMLSAGFFMVKKRFFLKMKTAIWRRFLIFLRKEW